MRKGNAIILPSMQEQGPPEQTLSIREAAQYVGLGETTIRRRIQSGELRAFKQSTPYGLEWRIVIPARPGGGPAAAVPPLQKGATVDDGEGATTGGGVTTGGGEGSTSSEVSDRVALALIEENQIGRAS